MNVRFISLAVAAFIGLVAAETDPNATSNKQVDFETANKALIKEWDGSQLKAALSCNIVDNYAFFNIQNLEGPYSFVVPAVVGDSEKRVEIHFCNPVYQNSTTDKSALAFILDSNNVRSNRLTSGSSTPDNDETRYNNVTGDVTGIYFQSGVSSDTNCTLDNKNEPYKTDFLINCDTENTNRSASLDVNKFTVTRDPKNICFFHVEATHAVGCPTQEYSAIIKFFSNNAWAVAIVLLAIGSASAFFGIKVFDEVLAGIAGLAAFLVMILFISAFGGFKALESNGEIGFLSVLIALISFAFAVLVSANITYFVYAPKFMRYTFTVAGAIGGMFLSFLIYNLFLGQIITSTGWVLWIFLVVGTLTAGYFAYKKMGGMIAILTSFLGSYTIVRGISLFFPGTYPNEFTMMSDMKAGDFDFPETYYAYLAGIVVVSVLGYMTQTKWTNQQKNWEDYQIRDGLTIGLLGGGIDCNDVYVEKRRFLCFML